MPNVPYTHPHQTITDFYSTWSLPHAANLLGSAIKAAQSEKSWKKGPPARLLFFFERLEELLTAVYALQENDEIREQAKLTRDKKHWWLTTYPQYCGWPKDYTPWDFFPRHLTQKEFLDPWKALLKIRQWQTLAEWKLLLKELLHDALANCTIHDFMNGEQALNAWLLLHKLIEATHLIEVRAIKEDEAGPRPKWKKRNP